ncbi:hypothetical protein SAMN05421831_1081 [Allopseudospirillum japonicum]|uniref:Uncharacterized protein n=1 Tax=Allopseudospirillum japonicum TaxID=64971 RepID=A0A1H6T1K9_9GAMM|nr:hypothetical protein [Allopseudospirillum japonicum]SEI70150.1 hypothetical protein SAMN05421831_1081 [Allopseudospirillum japonicum]
MWPIEGFTASALPVDVVSLDAQRQGAWITWSDLGAGESYFSTRLYYFDGQQVDQLYQVDFSDNYGVCGAQSQRICQGDDIYIQSYWHPTQAPINQYQFLQTRIHYQGIESDALQIKSIQTHIKSLTTQQLQ